MATKRKSAASQANGRPRVLFVVTATGLGGMELHVLRLAAALGDGFECTIGCLYAAPVYEERLASAGVRFENLAIGAIGSAWIRGGWRIRRLLSSAKPNIIQLYGFTSELWAPMIRLLAPRAVILTCRRNEDTNARHNRWRQRLNRFCDVVVCVSDETAAYAVNRECVPLHKIITIPNGVCIPHASARRESSARVRFGTLGNVKPDKGTDMLVDAFLKFPEDAPAELHMAGNVVDRERDRDWSLGIVEKAKRSHARDRITFWGHRSDAGDFLRDLDVFVLPSRSEGMSNALLEAMAHGLPCVATDVGSNRSVLGDTGLICEPNPDALFEAMQRLYVRGDLRRTLSTRARARVVQSFSHDAMVAAYSTLYADLLTSRRPARLTAASPPPVPPPAGCSTGRVL